MKVALVDMDGCVADEGHRNWIVADIVNVPKDKKQARWDAYHELMVNDKPFNEIIICVNTLPSDILVVILTGRPEKWELETRQQLMKWGVRHNHLIMRKDGDRQSAVHMKKRIAMSMIEIGLDIVKAYDDRADICDAYRKLEIPTIEVKHYG